MRVNRDRDQGQLVVVVEVAEEVEVRQMVEHHHLHLHLYRPLRPVLPLPPHLLRLPKSINGFLLINQVKNFEKKNFFFEFFVCCFDF